MVFYLLIFFLSVSIKTKKKLKQNNMGGYVKGTC